MNEAGAWIWTRRQRGVLAVIVLLLCAGFFVVAILHPLRVNDPLPIAGSRANELATKIDPNTADWPAWSALPLIGEKRAKEIVEFREKWLAEHPGEIAFEKPDDLMRVKGIGKATVAALRPYLLFPDAEGPTTRP